MVYQSNTCISAASMRIHKEVGFIVSLVGQSHLLVPPWATCPLWYFVLAIETNYFI